MLDNSVALSWLLPDEANERTDALADALERANDFVPSIWPLELGNALLMAQRRKRITEYEFKRCVAAVSALPIEVDSSAELARVLTIAQKSGPHIVRRRVPRTRAAPRSAARNAG